MPRMSEVERAGLGDLSALLKRPPPIETAPGHARSAALLLGRPRAPRVGHFYRIELRNVV